MPSKTNRNNDPALRRLMAQSRQHWNQGVPPQNPVYGMTWSDAASGRTKTYCPPGEWKDINGGYASWSNIAGIPACFPPCLHTHDSGDITNWPIGSWNPDPAITDPAVLSSLVNLRSILLSAGLIT